MTNVEFRKAAIEALELAWAWLCWFDGGDKEPMVPLMDVKTLLDELTRDSNIVLFAELGQRLEPLAKDEYDAYWAQRYAEVRDQEGDRK